MSFLLGKGKESRPKNASPAVTRRATAKSAPRSEATPVKRVTPATAIKAKPVQSATMRPESHLDFRGRMEWMLAFFMLGFSILALRAADLAILQGDKLRTKAQDQHRKKVVVQASRGRILDRNGRTLAISVPVKSLSIDRDRITDPDQFARRVGPLIGMQPAQLAKRLKSMRSGAFPVLKRQIPPDVADKIQRLKEPGTYFLPEVQRFYPLGEVAAHILGFVDMDGRGMEGLEKSYEKHLRGQDGWQMVTRDRLGQLNPEMQVIRAAQHGADISLTIDSAIQYIAYRALNRAVETSKAKAGIVMVMNPNNGQLLALVNQPSFNPNNLASSVADSRRNRATQDAYEPGSTFKMFIIAAALDKGTINQNSQLDCEGGRFRIKDRVIRDHTPHGLMSIQQILQKSSNICSAKIGLLMGDGPQKEYLVRLGLGRQTGIELGAEASGKLPDISGYREVGLANRSFGQGISATPIQIITATAAVMNGGLLYPPRLVLGKVKNGTFAPAKMPDPEIVFRPEISQMMREMLQSVVSPEGTAQQAAVEGYAVAGKTGTAQKAVPGLGYVSGRYFASFIGAVPAERPKLVVYVGIDEPMGKSYYGGEVAGPVFREIATEVLPILGALPLEHQNPALPPMREAKAGALDSAGDLDVSKMSLAQALELMIAKGVIPIVAGSGVVERQEKVGTNGIRLVLQ